MTLKRPERIVLGAVLAILAIAFLLWGACVATTGIDGANHVCRAVGRPFLIGVLFVGVTLWVSLRAAVLLFAGGRAQLLAVRHRRSISANEDL